MGIKYLMDPRFLIDGVWARIIGLVIDEFLSLFLLTRGSQTPIIPIRLLGIISGGTNYETML